jgi:hypothetical protein
VPIRGARRRAVLAIALAAALLLAAAAFAATQLVGVGSPVKAPYRSESSTRSTGVGVPVAGAPTTHVTAQLLALSVPDPAGGLPWGMRLVYTTRGLLCVQVGRLLGGRLGVLGQDGQFHDDGLFHELPVGVLDPDTCGQPQYTVLYHSEGMPADGAMPGPAESCLYPGATAPPSAHTPQCPAGDERAVEFGVLGPHATAISYRDGSSLRTEDTVGSHGAYLIVLRRPILTSRSLPPAPSGLRRLAPKWNPLDNVAGLGSSTSPPEDFPLDTGSSITGSSVVTSVLFRFGGRVCQSGAPVSSTALPQCTRALARVPVAVPEIARGLHTHVSMRVTRVSFGYELHLTFLAPAAVYDASTAYAVEITRPPARACGGGRAVSGQPIERDVARGQPVLVTVLVQQMRGCSGTVQGRVVYGRQPDAFTGPVGGVTVGRFVFELSR